MMLHSSFTTGEGVRRQIFSVRVDFLKRQLSENNELVAYKAEIFVRKKLSKPARSLTHSLLGEILRVQARMHV